MQYRLLKEEEIWGDKALEVMKNYGASTSLSDLAVLLGGMLGSSRESSNRKRAGFVWSASSDDYVRQVRTVGPSGDQLWDSPQIRKSAARPTLPSSETSKIRPNEVRTERLSNGKKVEVCTWGEYPQTVESDVARQNMLENSYVRDILQKTGKTYTFDERDLQDYDHSFRVEKYEEYTYQGEKYIRVFGNPADGDSILANNENVINGKAYWVKVEPVEWLKDPSGVWVAKEALFAGVQFDRDKKYNGDFNSTDMKKYLDTYFANELTPIRSNTYETENKKEEAQQKIKEIRSRKGWGVSVEETPMSVEEQIEFYVKTKKSFMLHGLSGIGKTARVEAIDPDLTAIPLWNGVLPEDVVGKVLYPSGQWEDATAERQPHGKWVAPAWYNELVKKCEAEPEKTHVLFIDEVTNARPTTQSMIFHLALKGSILPNEGKLPENTVVVLAGNNREESEAAYNMPEPLFRRMVGHIRLEPDVGSWLEWGSEKSRKHPEEEGRLNIHPLVSSFVAANSYRENVFYKKYDEENAEDWVVDPRGWEQVSDIIYDNKGVIRRELLKNKIGEELTAALIQYSKEPMLMLEDVMEGNYDRADIPETLDGKLAMVMNMRYANERQVGKVREFIEKELGAENRAVFDALWSKNNPERIMQIAELKEQRGER